MQKTDSCIVNVSWKNEPPTAVVAPDYMEPIEGTLVALDGTASMDPDDGIASHLWTQVEGDPVSLSDPTSAVTTFTAPKTDQQHGKNLKFKLTVKDFGGLQGTADSSIYVKQNELPNNHLLLISAMLHVEKGLHSPIVVLTATEPLCHGFGILRRQDQHYTKFQS